MQNTTGNYTQFLPGHVVRRHARDAAVPTAHSVRVRGAVLMADIMGYTALTERYSQRAGGVEELKDLLNGFFGRLTDIIGRHGGDIISFAGDAVFAVWNEEAGGEAVAAALAAQCALAAQAALDRSDLGEGLILRMRVVVATGELMIATVGGVAGKWHCLAAGGPLAALRAGLAQTLPGTVVLDPQTAAQLGNAARTDAMDSGYAKLNAVQRAAALPECDALLVDAAAIAALRCYISKSVLEQIDAGQFAWLTEFRRVATAFVQVRGIDSAGADALVQLQAVITVVQTIVERYEGTFQRAIVDEKGTNLLCVWGIPGCTHEDDPVRAISAGLAIAAALREPGRECGIGITTGRVMCGLSGGGRRYEYTAVGDAVNLAARLMVAAQGVLCDNATAEAARTSVEFEALGPLKVKGRDALLPVMRPLRLIDGMDKRAAAPRMARFLGRRSEMERLRAHLQALRTGAGAVVAIEGEPGVGKSQLVAEFQRAAAASGTVFLLGHADSIERSTTYFLWREILRQILDQSASGGDAQRALLEAMCEAEPALRVGLALLNDVLPLGFSTTRAVRQMSEQARAEMTRELLLFVLHRALAARPAVIVLEDAHWMDSMSWILAAQLRQREAALLLVLVTRSGHQPDTEQGRELLNEAAAQRIDLAMFSREDTEALVCDRLRVTHLPAAVLALIYERSDGHPLFSEELAYALRDSGYLQVRDGRCTLAGGAGVDARNLPATIEGIIAGRVDRLDASEQLTLKVASVFGRAFASQALAAVHPLHPDAGSLARQLENFVALDLVHAHEAAGGIDYQFKHIITQEVTYGLLAFAQRRQLHRTAADWYENAHAGALDAVYPLLAYHWSRAADAPRAFHFLNKAGEQAFRRYANREAADFFEEALQLQFAAGEEPAPEARAACERVLGFSQLWLGHLDKSGTHIRKSLAMRGRDIPATRGALARGIAGQQLLATVNHFLGRRFIRNDGPLKTVVSDVAESLIRLGHLAWFQSDVLMSLYISLRSLNLAERSPLSADTALIYSVMTSMAAAVPLHGLARRYRDLALEGAAKVNDAGLSSQVLLFVALYEGGLGDWDVGIGRVARAEKLSREIGDLRRAEECCVIHGYLLLHTGEINKARRYYEDAAASARRRGDRQTAGWGQLGIARIHLAQGRPDAALVALELAAPSVTDALGGVELHGMSALAHLRAGDAAQALRCARSGLQMLRTSRPVSFTTLTGTAGVAAAFNGLLAQALHDGVAGDAAVLKREARQALGLLKRFAGIFAIGWPQFYLQQGNLALALGSRQYALKAWRKSAESAAALAMPYDEALALLVLAQYEGGSSGTVAHARASALLEGMALPEPPSLFPHTRR